MAIGMTVSGYFIFHVLRKRRERRKEAQVDIPDFLSGRPNSGDKTSRSVEADWIEFLPSRKRK